MPQQSLTADDHDERGGLEKSLDRSFALLSLLTGIIALVSTSMLVYERLQIYMDASHVSVCDVNALLNCGTVMRTPYAEVFGFPNPFIGLVGYSIVITIAAALLAGARFRPWFWWSMALGHLLAFAFILYLWYNTTFEINALCLFCMIVWVMQIILFVKVVARNIAVFGPANPALVQPIAGWSWFVVVLILTLMFGIIIIRFFDVIVNML
ncbi:MAG: vitamin K epoxide reductase family protein [Rothia sp. (in: high G+C Gram-positive bacteria)]|nr:vitamin K epoxide reductase family protein [Rothia sp. (in: high G+C Gram-positive bacteria)]